MNQDTAAESDTRSGNHGPTKAMPSASSQAPATGRSDPLQAARRTDMEQFVEFQVHGQRYAFPIGKIREIIILKDVTPTPQVAAYVDGVSNLRGAIIPIINLRVLFGFTSKPADEETRTIVVNVGEKTMGCTVDSVSQVLRVEKESIAAAPETVTADGRNYIRGFVKVDHQLVIVLDVDQLLSIDNLDHVKKADLTL